MIASPSIFRFCRRTFIVFGRALILTDMQTKTYTSKKMGIIKNALFKAVVATLILILLFATISELAGFALGRVVVAIIAVVFPFLIVVMVVYGLSVKMMHVTVGDGKVTFYRRSKVLNTIDLDKEHVKPLIEVGNDLWSSALGTLGALLAGTRRYLIVSNATETGTGVKAKSLIKANKIRVDLSKENFSDLVSDIEEYYALSGQLADENSQVAMQNDFIFPKGEMLKKVRQNGIIATVSLALLTIIGLVVVYLLDKASFSPVVLLCGGSLLLIFWLVYLPLLMQTKGKKTPEIIAFTNSALHIDDKSFEWDQITGIKATPIDLDALSGGKAVKRRITIMTKRSKVTYNFGNIPPANYDPNKKKNVFIYDDYKSLVARLYQAMAPYGARVKSDF